MDKFEEYKFFAENTWKLSERRQSITHSYLTVNTGIIAVLSFLVKDAGFSGWGFVLSGLPLFVVGIIACVIWYYTILHYKALVGWRFEQLMEIEKGQAMAGSHQFYVKEKEDFLRQQNRESFGFSYLETWLPSLFLVLYVLYGVGVVIATILGYV